MTIRPPPAERTPSELLSFGVVNLDKPAGPTSHQVSGWVGDLCDVEEAGHAGTLDPPVTGTLPVLLGAATRLAPALSQGRKQYVAILELHDEPPADWRSMLDRFDGPIYQRPPKRSAVARKLRVREIYSLSVLERAERRVLLRVECEAGTYVRKLCHDLGLAIGTGGHMAALRRVESEPFDDRDLVTLHDLADALAFWRDGEWDDVGGVVKPAEAAIEHLPTITITEEAARNVATGAPVYAPGIRGVAGNPDHDDLVACTVPSGSAVCLGRLVGSPEATEGTVVDLERVLV